MSKVKIIATIGPSSNNQEVLEKLKDRGVNFFRINLSHTPIEQIESRIKDLLGQGVPIILDTEGSQVRSGNTQEIFFQEGATVKLHDKAIDCNTNNIFFKPEGIFKSLEEGDLISIDFNSTLLRIFDVSTRKNGYISCKVVIGGLVGGRKAVQIESSTLNMPAFSRKDHKAFELGKKYGINHFTLSFMESPESVRFLKDFYPQATLYSKIESKKGLENFLEIAKASDGVLIDRGDMSSQVSLEKIPFVQKKIIREVRSLNKEVFVATNTLEQMAFSLKPSKAEVNDIINTLLDGATGIALTKETATGKYPVETVNMLSLLIKQVDFLNKQEDIEITDRINSANYLSSKYRPEMLVKPHGGVLVQRADNRYSGEIPQKSVGINESTLLDAEQISTGAFSPLEGFMNKEDFESVINDMRLTNGLIWPLPVYLSVSTEEASKLNQGEKIALTHNGETHALMDIDQIYSINKEEAAQKIYGTLDNSHPGVRSFLQEGDVFLGGKITLIKRRSSANKIYELTPKQTRKIFSERGWSKIVGFHTRNIVHRSHEFIQLQGLKKGLCDGLFIHPVVGKKKQGDFLPEIIIETYERAIEEFYPKSKVILSTLATHSRYAGPREAIFTALIRKNFGCSHFIVGRDHTGVGDFYNPKASHEIFDKFSSEELGIKILKFDNVFYSTLEKEYIHEPEFLNHPQEHRLAISGTHAREMLTKGVAPPEWFMRPEISQTVLNSINQGKEVFVS